MSYISGSEGPSVSGYDVQGPKPLPASAFTTTIAPAAEALAERPSYVIINVESATKYEFSYTTGSFTDYGIVAADGPIRIDIQPLSWKGGAGTTGHVTFVYKGGL